MDFQKLHRDLICRILEGAGTASRIHRRAAFDHEDLDEPLGALIDKVANQSWKISDEELSQVKRSGVSEDQIFELFICAAVGQSTRQYELAMKVLDEVADDIGGNENESRNTQ